MLKRLKLSAIALLLCVGFVLPAEAITPEIVTCALYFVNSERLREREGNAAADLYLEINHPARPLHQDAAVRKKIYDIFREHMEHPKEVLQDLAQQTADGIEDIAFGLSELPPASRSQVLNDLSAWKTWREKFLQHEEMVTVQGHKVLRSFYEESMQLRQELAKEGLITEFVPGVGASQENQGRGLLVIKKNLNVSNVQGLQPHLPAIQTQKFQELLRTAEKEGGAIVIDPDLGNHKAAAYFGQEGLHGYKYYIGLSPETHGGFLKHEWTHKEDRIDRQSQFPGSLYDKELPVRSNAWGRGLDLAGKFLEENHVSELNATAAQLGLYFETRKFPLKDMADTLLYRGVNQMKVAVGRIYQQPSQPKHYFLYLKGVGTFMLPVAAFAGPLLTAVIKLAPLAIAAPGESSSSSSSSTSR